MSVARLALSVCVLLYLCLPGKLCLSICLLTYDTVSFPSYSFWPDAPGGEGETAGRVFV